METYLLNQAALFTLILGRIGGLVATAPLLSNQTAPVRVRALLAVALTVVVLPTQHGEPLTDNGALGATHFAVMVMLELIVGMLLGLGMTILLSGVQVTGQVVAQVSGMSLGDVFNPALDDSVSVFSQLFFFVTLAAFVAVGGHRMMMDALLGTFAWAPPGHAVFHEDYARVLVGLLSQSFELGVRAAAPLLIALFLSTVVLGLISRTLPQINTVAVGFSVNSLVTLSVMFLSLGGVVWTFQAPLDDVFAMLVETLKSDSTATTAPPLPFTP